VARKKKPLLPLHRHLLLLPLLLLPTHLLLLLPLLLPTHLLLLPQLPLPSDWRSSWPAQVGKHEKSPACGAFFMGVTRPARG
jgi:hypothetical protein